MRYAYWWGALVLGIVLIVAPFAESFRRAATYTDVVVGILLLIWALMGYQTFGRVVPSTRS